MNESETEKEAEIRREAERLLRMAEAKLDKKEYNEAIKYYTQIISISPTDAWTYWDRGLAKRDKNDVTGAMKDFDQAIQIQPENSFFYYQRALLKEKKGDKKGMVADLDKVEELRRSGIAEIRKLYKNKNSLHFYTQEKDGRSGI